MIGYFVIVGVFTAIGFFVSRRLKSKFKKYSQFKTQSGLSGAEIAQEMLRHFGVSDVQVKEGRGMLTDHYNPLNKTVSLSPEVYNGRHVAAAAVAAHECGHAVQHAQSYAMLGLRSNLVPIVKFSSTVQQFLFMAFIFGMGFGLGGQTILIILTASFGITALFSLVTLPVEFDASNRALIWLDESGFTHGAEYEGAKDALWWAAMTYVSSALASLVIFLFFALRLVGSD